jgi:hypothetical protein
MVDIDTNGDVYYKMSSPLSFVKPIVAEPWTVLLPHTKLKFRKAQIHSDGGALVTNSNINPPIWVHAF